MGSQIFQTSHNDIFKVFHSKPERLVSCFKVPSSVCELFVGEIRWNTADTLWLCCVVVDGRHEMGRQREILAESRRNQPLWHVQTRLAMTCRLVCRHESSWLAGVGLPAPCQERHGVVHIALHPLQHTRHEARLIIHHLLSVQPVNDECRHQYDVRWIYFDSFQICTTTWNVLTRIIKMVQFSGWTCMERYVFTCFHAHWSKVGSIFWPTMYSTLYSY